jgi:hypothetical protein
VVTALVAVALTAGIFLRQAPVALADTRSDVAVIANGQLGQGLLPATLDERVTTFVVNV